MYNIYLFFMSYKQEFIVQENFRDNPVDWWVDPDQPAHTAVSLDRAIKWLADDFAGFEGHQTSYIHRIIKQTTQECYSSEDIDKKLNNAN